MIERLRIINSELKSALNLILKLVVNLGLDAIKFINWNHPTINKQLYYVLIYQKSISVND